MKPETAVIASGAFACLSVAFNFWGGVAREKKRAELQLEVRPVGHRRARSSCDLVEHGRA